MDDNEEYWGEKKGASADGIWSAPTPAPHPWKWPNSGRVTLRRVWTEIKKKVIKRVGQEDAHDNFILELSFKHAKKCNCAWFGVCQASTILHHVFYMW